MREDILCPSYINLQWKGGAGRVVPVVAVVAGLAPGAVRVNEAGLAVTPTQTTTC